MSFAGTPASTELSPNEPITTALAPTIKLSPSVIGPKIFDPVEILQLSPIMGTAKDPDLPLIQF
jgi:hypothetical protein